MVLARWDFNGRDALRPFSFRAVRCAFIDEAPRLHAAATDLPAPLTIFGLFAGDGMHAGEDMPRLIAGLDRRDVVFAGTIAGLDGVESLIATAVAREPVSG